MVAASTFNAGMNLKKRCRPVGKYRQAMGRSYSGGGVYQLLLITLFAPIVCSTIPDVITTVERIEGSYNVDPIYAKRAAFGGTNNVNGQLVPAPPYDPYLCEWYNSTRNESLPIYHRPLHDTVMLAARGEEQNL